MYARREDCSPLPIAPDVLDSAMSPPEPGHTLRASPELGKPLQHTVRAYT